VEEGEQTASKSKQLLPHSFFITETTPPGSNWTTVIIISLSSIYKFFKLQEATSPVNCEKSFSQFYATQPSEASTQGKCEIR
jgi:hypothetical protein